MTGGNLHDQGIEFNHCRFIDNKAAKQAGGICVTKSVGAGSLDFFACVAEGNNGSVLAGFMSYLSAGIAVRSITLDSCRLLKNYSELGAPGLNLTSFVDVRTVFVLKNSEITQHNSSEVSTYGVINLSSASDYAVDSVWILNNNFHDNQGYSVCALGSSLYAAFTGNTITNNNFGAYIYAPYCYIENNIAENNLSSAISSGGYLSVLCNNLFAQNGNSQLSYFQLFYNATNSPMGIQIKNYVFNNTFIDNLYQDNHNPNSTPATGLNICYNNIFQGNTNTFDGQLGIPLQTDLDSNYFAYNLLDRDCNTLGARSICGPGNLLTSDPQFVDAAAKDYRLSPCSPGVDAGWNALPDTFHILSDLNGLPRIINGFVDIGAYENPAFALAEAPVIKAACSGLANGSVSFAVSNGCPAYQLTWANGSENSLIINNLMAGSYQISLTDSQNKATVVSIVIPASNMVVTPTIQKASSATTPDGAISLAVSAGLAPYQYLWSDGNTSAQRSGLLPGFYQLTITVYPCSYRQIAGHTSLTGLSLYRPQRIHHRHHPFQPLNTVVPIFSTHHFIKTVIRRIRILIQKLDA